jgi:glycosyltransferase involved in cell wall biosynthesis
MENSSTKKIKICYIYFDPISLEKNDFLTLVPIRTAEMLGDKVEIHVFYSGYINEKSLIQKGIFVHTCPFFLAKVPCIFRLCLPFFIYRLGKKERIDIFMNVANHYFLFSLMIPAKLCKAKLLARISGVPIQGRSRKSLVGLLRYKAGLLIERFSLEGIDLVHALSNKLKNIYIARGINPAKIVVVSQGCNTSKFSPRKTYKNQKKKRILYVGRLDANKRVKDIINAFALIHKKYNDCELVIAGMGEILDELYGLCSELEIGDCTRFLQYVNHDELPSLYNKSDILILVSHSEGLPNVVLEAQACSLPVVGTDAGELPILLERNRGILLNSVSPRAIAEAVINLLENEKMRKEMGRRAREYVVGEHSFEAVKHKYIDMFNSVIKD